MLISVCFSFNKFNRPPNPRRVSKQNFQYRQAQKCPENIKTGWGFTKLLVHFTTLPA